MKISVIIPVYNEEKYLASCLQHVFDQEVKADEVIVVDNNSTDKSMAIARKFPVKIVKQKIQGRIPARNMGFDTAVGTIIARTDADTLVPKDWLKKIKSAFEDKRVIAFSGPARFSDVPETPDISKIPMYAFFRSFKKMYNHDCLFGPNLAVKKSAWKKVRGSVCMDDKLVHEDVDLSLHISKVGKIAFDYSCVVTSSARRWRKLKPYYEYSIRYLNTIKQHHDSLTAYKTSSKLAKKIVRHTKKVVGFSQKLLLES